MREQEYGKVVLRHINGKYSVTLLYYALRWNYVLQLLELSWQARICPIQIFRYLKNLQTDLATLHMQVQIHNQQPKNPVVIYLVLEYILFFGTTYDHNQQPQNPVVIYLVLQYIKYSFGYNICVVAYIHVTNTNTIGRIRQSGRV